MPSRVGRTRSALFCRCLTGGAWAIAVSVSAGLMVIALGSSTYWWLGWVTLVPLFLAIRLLRPMGALAAGAVWGSALYFLSSTLGSTAIPQTPVALVLLTVIPALYTCLGCIVTARKGFHPFLLGLGWAGVELALQPLALRNGLLPAAMGNSAWVLTLGKMGGYILVAFLVAFVNAAILSILSGVRLWVRRPRVVVAVPQVRQTLRLLEDLVLSWQCLELIHPRPPPAGRLG